jgi:uncharacterized membrane protein
MREMEFKISLSIIIIILAVLTIYPIVLEYRSSASFSELGILGLNKTFSNYPTNVVADQNFTLYLYLENHQGEVGYYRVVAKQGDMNSIINNTITLNSPVIAYWDFIVLNEKNCTTPINLSMPRAGVNQRLVFELYVFDSQNSSFIYNHSWTQLWMNVISSG